MVGQGSPRPAGSCSSPGRVTPELPTSPSLGRGGAEPRGDALSFVDVARGALGPPCSLWPRPTRHSRTLVGWGAGPLRVRRRGLTGEPPN